MHSAVSWAGETLHLLPEHAISWPRGGALFVADLHIGKAAAYRAQGQPVPRGTTATNLRRLDELIARHAPRELVVLGDFLHDATAQQANVASALASWRGRHPLLAITVVRGNHDARAGALPQHLAIVTVDEPHLLGPFACCHEPRQHPSHFVLAGHVHPVCMLLGSGRDRLRLPCFVEDREGAILPSFGAFTGGWQVRPSPGRRLHVVGDGQVWTLPRA